MIETRLTPELATRFATIALGHVGRAYPHKLDQVLSGPEDLAPPQVLHPIFYGSFDWHSCVHSYWLLARIRQQFPDLPICRAVTDQLNCAIQTETVSAELAYLTRPFTGGFERPYGWAWALKLAAELQAGDRQLAQVFSPLAKAFAQRFHTYLPKATYPVRAGVHSNTAFALSLALDYARVCQDRDLENLICAKALAWHLDDRDCQAWEPDGDAFLSPALSVAVLMAKVMQRVAFQAWFADFLPRLSQGEPKTLLTPAVVSDPTDGKNAHLDGLNLYRAYAFGVLAKALPSEAGLQAVARQARHDHLAASLATVAGDFMGEHWLASFALLALDLGDVA